ncbi:MAG: hypothetical protein ACKVQW_16530 [Pyrinomonadaceae bacterium]
MADKLRKEEIKRYIFREMSAEESDAFEDRYFNDDSLFDELTATEKEIVDLQITGRLTGGDLERFKRVADSPGIRRKIADAGLTKLIVAEESALRGETHGRMLENQPVSIPGGLAGLWRSVTDVFSVRMPVAAFGAAAALILLLGIGFLIRQDVRLRQETADLIEQSNEEIATTESRSDNPQKSAEQEPDSSLSPNNRIEMASNGSEPPRQSTTVPEKAPPYSQPQNDRPLRPTLTVLASGILTPVMATRGSSDGGPVTVVKITPDTKFVRFDLEPPKNAVDISTIKLVDGPDLPVKRRVTRNGKAVWRVMLKLKDVRDGGEDDRVLMFYTEDWIYPFRLEMQKAKTATTNTNKETQRK